MANSDQLSDLFKVPDCFTARHIGPRAHEIASMLETLGLSSLDELADKSVPQAIRMRGELRLRGNLGEREVLAEMCEIASKNQVFRSYLGLGYANCQMPPVIQRNVLENPGWYTQYTPYQAEISQGRLETLLAFQTMIADLTALPMANASLLDEGTAAAEAMTLCKRVLDRKAEGRVFFVSQEVHPQTIAVVRTRALPLGIEVVVGDHEQWDFSRPTFGALVQYPTTGGAVLDYEAFCAAAHKSGALVVVAADLLSLALLRAPGEFGADVAVGNSQRFGVPLGFGGPHAAFMAVRDEHKRQLPGRLIGLSKDNSGNPALRLALQSREQHIRRERATSNICTAQVLLAELAAFYAIYHGPEGLTRIARQAHGRAVVLARALQQAGWRLRNEVFFDTLRVGPGPRSQEQVLRDALARKINLRAFPGGDIGVALDETVSDRTLADLVAVFGGGAIDVPRLAAEVDGARLPAPHARTSRFLAQPVFHRYRSETELLRYIKRLESRDLSLTTSMIPLGSCTMKLNAAAEMYPISWATLGELHPAAPAEQAQGYRELFDKLAAVLQEITGFAGTSFMPNAGSAGEYTGLLVIRAYHRSRGDAQRDVCLIPTSAHGTNPASAVLAGLRVVAVACDENGNIDVADLRAKAREHAPRLAALMVTYPSTHGVFEEAIREICSAVHECGGQVYLDGANMNALVGLCRPAEFGADVCHLNLHKTFAIPHGGGGPGMGPICVARHLVPFLPSHPLQKTGGEQAIGPVASSAWGSPSILPISYAYVTMMGADGLKLASLVAILNANYLAKRLDPHYPVLYKGRHGFVAHECIVDLRGLKATAAIEAEDVAKRLMDYGFHAPTLSFPVPGTLMIEPTESESLFELDRFCEAMIAIREEIREIEDGRADRQVNLLKMAPHTAAVIAADGWDRPYSRERAAFPSAWTREHKFWPYVGRIDNAYGDRNLVCSWPPA
ncbi:MAG: aminomethyl-transferring glycine dehydrogenase [Acidobacteria bacterium]|nr:aminomethyl-transferring glycine dehydrogenase [Acidobacteriota bacterium]